MAINQRQMCAPGQTSSIPKWLARTGRASDSFNNGCETARSVYVVDDIDDPVEQPSHYRWRGGPSPGCRFWHSRATATSSTSIPANSAPPAKSCTGPTCPTSVNRKRPRSPLSRALRRSHREWTRRRVRRHPRSDRPVAGSRVYGGRRFGSRRRSLGPYAVPHATDGPSIGVALWLEEAFLDADGTSAIAKWSGEPDKSEAGVPPGRASESRVGWLRLRLIERRSTSRVA